MTEKEYYDLFDDYGQFLRQKKFNRYVCDQKKLNKIKRAISKELSKSIELINDELIHAKRECAKTNKSIATEKNLRLVYKKDTLIDLRSKVNSEQALSPSDYENTFCNVRTPFWTMLSTTLITMWLSLVDNTAASSS